MALYLFVVCAAPKLPENAVPDGKDAVDGATIPLTKFGVPEGSMSPFWITMKTSPFLFPTVSPWFIIPGKRDSCRFDAAKCIILSHSVR